MFAFLLELLLYSGQYGAFYLLMSVVHAGYVDALTEPSHAVLLFSLIIQCSLLARYGNSPRYRFLFSLILPLAYTGVEYVESPLGIWNMAHVFFWFFALVTGSVHAFSLWRKTPRSRLFSESVISFANVAVFVLVYFYFDLLFSWEKSGVTWTDLQNRLSIENFPAAFQDFLHDPVHGYFLIGTLILAGSIAIARSRILRLQDRVTHLLGTYVDASVRDKILDSKDRNLISETKTAVILFSDIRNFTSMSERSSPEEVVRFLNGYFSLWEEAVRQSGGWIDKFIGDAVMVVFDTGTEEENVRAAMICAQRVFWKLPLLRKGIFAEGEIGVGIHSGKVIMGDIGSISRRNYTVIGDTVNVASRLEGLCKELGAVLVISDTAYSHVSQDFPLDFLGMVDIRGKRQQMKAFGKRK